MSNEKFLLVPAAGDIDEDEGQTLRQIYDQLKAQFEPSGEDTFTVKHYTGEDEVSLVGAGFDLYVAEDRDDVEEFALYLNDLVKCLPKKANNDG